MPFDFVIFVGLYVSGFLAMMICAADKPDAEDLSWLKLAGLMFLLWWVVLGVWIFHHAQWLNRRAERIRNMGGF